MKKLWVSALLAIISLMSFSELQAQESKDGFVPLFNGKDLNNWVNINGAPGTWLVKDGMIDCTGKPICILRTDRHYENFILELEWRHLKPKGNAGVFIWSDALTAKGQPFTRGVEVQILDGREGSWYTSDGDVFPVHGATMKPENGRKGSRAFPTEKRSKPSPEWNHYRVECIDGVLKLAVNGKIVTVGRECNPRKGYIALESEGSPIQFKNIIVKELPPSKNPPTAEETATLGEGFRNLYTGVDMSGWKKSEKNDGHWQSKGWRLFTDGKGDHLWSEEEFSDFQLMIDWRWTAKPKKMKRPVFLADGTTKKDENGKAVEVEVDEAGDSGIYLRGNSKSQVNIWCWPCGSGEIWGYRLDKKLPAEIRAACTPKLNADAKIGKWNRFLITMQGEFLTVELNGKTVIEKAQLKGVPKSGPIALQKHGSPIEFGNIFIREMK